MSKVQSASFYQSPASTSTGLAYTSDVTAGNLLLCWIDINNGSGLTIDVPTDTQGNTWTAIRAQSSNGSLDAIARGFFAIAGSSAANSVHTPVTGGTGSGKEVILEEYDGGFTALDASNAAIDSGVSVTTTIAHDLLVGVVVASSPATIDSPWTASQSGPDAIFYDRSGYLLDSGSPGSKTFAFTVGSQSIAIVAAFNIPVSTVMRGLGTGSR